MPSRVDSLLDKEVGAVLPTVWSIDLCTSVANLLLLSLMVQPLGLVCFLTLTAALTWDSVPQLMTMYNSSTRRSAYLCII